jgi:hypothetical protein
MAVSVGSVVFQISADLKKLQAELRTMEGSFQSSFGKIEGMAVSFGKGLLQGIAGGFSVRAIIGFTKEILNLADSLQNLSDQTGLTVQLLSGLKSPLEEAGSSVESFAQGVFNLQKNLGNVDKETDPAAQAIKRLGLNLKELRNISPDEFIKKITDALGQIQNPVERSTILFNLLGKSAKELGPAFAQLAGHFDEFRAKGLSAADIQTLDAVGDALTRLKNQAVVLGAEGVAGLLRFFNVLRDVPKIGTELDRATTAMARILNLPKERVEAMTSKEIISGAEQAPEPLRRSARLARDELLDLREEFEKVNSAFKKPIPVPFKEPLKGLSESAKTAKNDVDNFLQSLEKQLASLESKEIELRLGPQTALAKDLDLQFANFKEKLKREGLPIPKGLDQFFTLLRDKILDANKAIAQTTFEMERLGQAARMFDQDMEEIARGPEELAKNTQESLKQVEEQFRQLQKTLSIEKLPESERGQAQVMQDYAERIELIQKWRDAQIQATGDVEEINRQAAQAVSDAWTASQQKLKTQADQTSEFVRRAFERGFDAVSDTLRDVLDNGFKGFQDFGEKIRKTLNALVADILTLQLKNFVLGPQYGQGGGTGQIGGLLGQLLGTTQQQGSGQRPPGVQGPMLPGGFYSQRQTGFAEMEPPYRFPPGSTPPFNPASGGMPGQWDWTNISDSWLNALTKPLPTFFNIFQKGLEAAVGTLGGAGGGTSGGGFFGALLGLFGMGGGASAAGTLGTAQGSLGFDPYAGLMGGAAFIHKGGIAGYTLDHRMIDPAVFYRAERYHGGGMPGGLRGDEIPAILQRGETVIPRGMSMGGAINININSPDADGFRRSKATILADITRAVRKGQKHL